MTNLILITCRLRITALATDGFRSIDVTYSFLTRMTQEDKDLALARQLQEEEQENRNRMRREEQRRRDRSSESSCKVS